MKQTKRDIKIVSFSDSGDTCAIKIANGLIDIKESAEVFSGRNAKSLKAWMGRNFNPDSVIVFVTSCDTAIRTLAPFLKGKNSDPAVLVTDEKGEAVVALISGKKEEANIYAQMLSGILDTRTVITIKRDIDKLPEIEAFARRNSLTFADTRKISEFSKAFALEKRARVMIPDELKDMFSFSERIPDEFEIVSISKTGVVKQSDSTREAAPSITTSFLISPYTFKYRVLQMIPKCFVLCVDSPAGAGVKEIEALSLKAVKKAHIHMSALKCVSCGAPSKTREGVVEFSKALNLPLETKTPASLRILNTVTDPSGVSVSVGITPLILFA